MHRRKVRNSCEIGFLELIFDITSCEWEGTDTGVTFARSDLAIESKQRSSASSARTTGSVRFRVVHSIGLLLFRNTDHH